MKMNYFIVVAIAFFTQHVGAAQYSYIDCTWPCLNPSDKCVVTVQGASCGSRDITSWILNTPERSPYYTGAYVSIALQPCQPVPIPKLSSAPASNASTVIGQSVIMWPISNLHRPQDEYLGNCRHGLYCSSFGQDKSNPVCRQKFALSSACVSPNQCSTGFCTNRTCQYNYDATFGDGRGRYGRQYDEAHYQKVGQVVAAVFGSLGALVVAVICFILYLRHKRNKKKAEEEDVVVHGKFEESPGDTAGGASNIYNDADLQKFSADYGHEETPTPAMQQMQLQHDMLQSHIGDNNNEPKPPPYHL